MKKSLWLLAFLISSFVFAQDYGPGNVIPDYGKTFTVESPEFKTNTSGELKAVIDVDRSFDPSQPNKLIETAARYLNMHEKAGVDPKNMKIALVLHGNAVFDIMKDEFYTEKYPEVKKNPNLPLIDALTNKGVQVILCGQSAAHHKVTREKADENAHFALSAMTALVQLQNDDYRLIKF
ncbi:DsrE family protein [Gramella jeungdoensis]|uniref:DsrE family protein n=1 Tax=Gramella jeungdoensis TaxID=708091 RepID=A0ABT0YXD4_9FLAO|nr:DsrE family protein [Gramella jeungdoensis]MCM8568127.1 DsrE family protein [Gramella jeungdoensis]